MAGGTLTPRQKMINMMYLVLTAMLALNVSAEVLDAFVNIDKSIEHNIQIVAKKNAHALAEFRMAAAENPEKVAPWLLKAEEVSGQAEALYSYIQGLKLQLVRAGDGEDSEALLDTLSINPEKIESLSNTDASSRLMVGNDHTGYAFELRERLTKYKDNLASMVDARRGATVRASVEELLKTEDGVTDDGEARTWEVGTFESIPLISAVAVLSKLQLDVYNCESEVITHLSNEVDASDFKFSDIDVAIIPSSNYVIKGTEFSAEMFLAAYDPTQRPILHIGNQTYVANEKGKIMFKTIPSQVGQASLRGTIEFTGPDGKQTRPVQLDYRVVEPNTVVSPTKMNVVYRGIDNPVSISSSGIPLDRLEIHASNGSIERQGQTFNLRPGEGRTCEITVSVDGKNMGTQSLRVKDLPPPTPLLDGISSKIISKSELLASQGIRAEMPRDFDFDLKFRVVSYTASATIDGYNLDETAQSELFGDKQRNLFNRLKPGQRIVFTDIKAKGPDGRSVDLPDLSIKIK